MATERGHRVTVLDKSDRLGGTLWFSSLTTPDNERLLRWLKLRDRAPRRRCPAEHRGHGDVRSRHSHPDAVVLATGAVRGRPDVPGGDLPHVHTGDTLRALMTGSGDASEQPLFLRTMGRLGKLSGITKSPAAIRTVTRKFLPMGKDVVVIGGSLVGLELAEFLAERGRRNVTLLEEGAQLGLPMAMPRRWTAVRHAERNGRDHPPQASVQRITQAYVEFRVGDKTLTRPGRHGCRGLRASRRRRRLPTP